MTFRIGQKVVNVKGSEGDFPIRGVVASRPSRGDVCTIKTINRWPTRTILTLFEHDNSHLIGRFDCSGLEPGFDAECFRPIVERKTDISIFTAMLSPKTTERRIDAVAHDHGFDPPKF